jgi:hypothetical protein
MADAVWSSVNPITDNKLQITDNKYNILYVLVLKECQIQGILTNRELITVVSEHFRTTIPG